jgi:large subunit ribosomal protein L10
MQTTRTYSKKKVQMYKDLVELIRQYKVITLLKMEKVRSTQLMQVRKKFRTQLKIIMTKNNIAKKALAAVEIKGMEKILEGLEGQRAFMFTNMDPFKLSLELDKSKIYLPAKGGNIATDEIVIPAGNTGIPPGPVLSEFKEAKVQTKIDSGSIAVSEDTVVALPGDVLSHKLSALLGKLNIKPIKAGMTVFMALQDGVLYREEDLIIDIEGIKLELLTSSNSSLALAINVSYATKETIEQLLEKAFADARNLSVNSEYVNDETIKELLYANSARAQALYESVKKLGYS